MVSTPATRNSGAIWAKSWVGIEICTFQDPPDLFHTNVDRNNIVPDSGWLRVRMVFLDGEHPSVALVAIGEEWTDAKVSIPESI